MSRRNKRSSKFRSQENSAQVAVFVYGSLKQGRGNAYLLQAATQIGTGYVRGELEMLSLGGFPGVVNVSNNDKMIYGELYRVDQETMDALDCLEGYPDFYTRGIYSVHRPEHGDVIKAFMYTLPGGYIDRCPIVASGVWDATPKELDIMAEFVNYAKALDENREAESCQTL